MPYQLRIGPNVTQSTTAIINDATEDQVGVVSLKQVREASGDTGEDDVFIYVNSVTGSDNKNGKTPNNAVKTISKALSLVPCCWKKHMQLIFAPGTYPFTGNGGFGAGSVGEPVGPDSKPIALIGGFTNEIGTKTVTVGSNGESVTGVLGLAVDVYYGAWISMTSGANNGQRRMIAGNTANDIFVNAPFASPISAGDKFKVEKPNVIFDVTGFWGFTGGGLKAAYKGIKFNLIDQPGIGQAFVVNERQIGMEGCEIAGNGTGSVLVFHGAHFDAESFPPPVGGNTDPLNPFSFLRLQAGVFIHDCNVGGGALTVFDRCAFEFYIMLNNVSFNCSDYANITLQQCFAKNSTFAAFNLCDVAIFGFESNGPASVNAVWDANGLVSGLNAAITVDGVSYLQAFGQIINNSGGDAIFLGENSHGFFGFLSGSGNAGYGFVLDTLSQFFTFFGTNTIFGASGELSVGATAPVAWAALPVSDAARFCLADA